MHCTAEDLPKYLETIRSEVAPAAKVEAAIQCALKLAPTGKTAELLIGELDRTLKRISSLPYHKTEFEEEARIAAALAGGLHSLKIPDGYQEIARYFASVDWSDPNHLAFFDRIVAHASRRSELTETFYLALTRMPASHYLGRVCSVFNRGFEPVREEPRFLREVVSAISRLEQEKPAKDYTRQPRGDTQDIIIVMELDEPAKNYAKESCEKTFLSQLLDEKMREAFLASFLDQLSANEQRILQTFLAKIAPPPDTEVVGHLIKAFFSVPWKAKVSTLQKKDPNLTCEAFRGDGSSRGADELWCHACSVKAGQLDKNFYFYLDRRGKSCTLQKVSFSYPSTSNTAVKSLSEQLAKRLGPATLRYKVPEMNLIGEAYFWTWRGWEVYVFSNQSLARQGEGLPLVEILGMSQELITAMEQQRELERILDYHLIGPEQHVNKRMVEELQISHPMVGHLLGQKEPEQAQVYNILLQLLDNTKTAPPRQQALFLLAADRLASQLGSAEEFHSPQWDQQRLELARYGLNYHWDPLGAAWVYTYDLLWRVWEAHGSTEWGEHAFTLLLNHGWDRSDACGQGSDQFRDVIHQAEQFLAKRPKSPRRLHVVFALAQAYETWWSLSRAKQDDYVDSSQHQKGAAIARKRAAKYYEQILSLASKSPEAIYARWRLPRLKLGLDTNQRRFYCIYD